MIQAITLESLIEGNVADIPYDASIEVESALDALDAVFELSVAIENENTYKVALGVQSSVSMEGTSVTMEGAADAAKAAAKKTLEFLRKLIKTIIEKIKQFFNFIKSKFHKNAKEEMKDVKTAYMNSPEVKEDIDKTIDASSSIIKGVFESLQPNTDKIINEFIAAEQAASTKLDTEIEKEIESQNVKDDEFNSKHPAYAEYDEQIEPLRKRFAEADSAKSLSKNSDFDESAEKLIDLLQSRYDEKHSLTKKQLTTINTILSEAYRTLDNIQECLDEDYYDNPEKAQKMKDRVPFIKKRIEIYAKLASKLIAEENELEKIFDMFSKKAIKKVNDSDK